MGCTTQWCTRCADHRRHCDDICSVCGQFGEDSRIDMEDEKDTYREELGIERERRMGTG